MYKQWITKALMCIACILCGCTYEHIQKADEHGAASAMDVAAMTDATATVCDVDKTTGATSNCHATKINLRKVALMAMLDTKKYLREMQADEHQDADTIMSSTGSIGNNPIDTLLRNIPTEITFEEDNLIIFAAAHGKPFSRDLMVKYKTKEGLWLMTLQMQDYIDEGPTQNGMVVRVPDYKCVYVSGDNNQPMFYYDSKSNQSQMVSRSTASGMFNVSESNPVF